MKKLIVVLIIICVLFAVAIGYMNKGATPAEDTQSSASETAASAQPDAVTEPAESAEPIVVQGLDYAAMYALHDGDEVVMTISGKDVTWDDYFSWLYLNGNQVENYFNNFASYYGVASKWTDSIGDEAGTTYAKYVVDGVDSTLLQFAAVEGLAEESGLVLSQDSLAAIETQKANDIVSMCGEGATEEDFKAKLAEMYMSEASYKQMTEVNYIYQENFTAMYGENGAKVSDEDALAYLEDNGYLSANHILLMTMDSSTGEALDEATVAEKKATADKLYEELSAITDPAALEKRFKELKEEYCEDSGKTNYPDGYVFTPGTMVAEFEDACNSLEDYGLSKPVESSYGYHIILRLPASADRTMEYSDAGTALSARAVYANNAYAKALEEYMSTLTVQYAAGFEAPNVLDYLK